MSILLGATLAAGILLAVSPWLWPAGRRSSSSRPRGRTIRLVEEAGFPAHSSRTLLLTVVIGAVVAAAITWLVTGIGVLATLAAVAGGAAPIAFLRGRRLRLRRLRRQLWPDVCDLLIASIRVGLSLPDAVATLAESAPPLCDRPSRCSPGTCRAADGSRRVSTD